MIQKSIHFEVDRYVELGWSFIPCKRGTKEPAVRSWKPFQERHPTNAERKRWLAKDPNIAIVCGNVSASLVVRDFDTEATYSEWKRNERELATTLPTVKTSKGYHVYCRMSPCPRVKIKNVGEGELRGNGAYVIAPPSKHPNGRTIYRWLIEPFADLPIVSLAQLNLEHLASELIYEGMLHSQLSKPSQRRKPSKPKPTYSIEGVGILDVRVFEESILKTVPTRPGERNRSLFELARRVKAQTETDLEIRSLMAIFDHWWFRAETIIATKDYAVSLDDFLRAYQNAKTAFGETMEMHLNQAIASGFPSWVPAQFSDKCKLLASLCRQLHHANADGTFYLSTHTAGQLLETPVMTCWRWLNLFEKLGMIEKIENGSVRERKASLFRYCADDL